MDACTEAPYLEIKTLYLLMCMSKLEILRDCFAACWLSPVLFTHILTRLAEEVKFTKERVVHNFLEQKWRSRRFKESSLLVVPGYGFSDGF
jgi:hypothetical protein